MANEDQYHVYGRNWPQRHTSKEEENGNCGWIIDVTPDGSQVWSDPSTKHFQPNWTGQNQVHNLANGARTLNSHLLGYDDSAHIPNVQHFAAKLDINTTQVPQLCSEVSTAEGHDHSSSVKVWNECWGNEAHYDNTVQTLGQDIPGPVSLCVARVMSAGESGIKRPLEPDRRYSVPDYRGGSYDARSHPENNDIDTLLGSTENTVTCPNGCGTVLTGVHASGNLTRHLKSQTCSKSAKAKLKYTCGVLDCGSEYSRSDGLKVHMRKRHGAPAALPKIGTSVDHEDEDEEDWTAV